eukprot:symbB.v1.2.016781.t1/scaffold1290.1/size126440/2
MYVEGQLQAVSKTGQPIAEEQLVEERRASAEAAEKLLKLVTDGPKEYMSMSTGDVVAMDCRVFHQGGANVSSETRVLFNASFQLDENPSEDVSPKIHGFTGERELKAEIRAAQRLLLEVAESARHISPERLTASQVTKAGASAVPAATPAPLPALPGFGTDHASSSSVTGLDAGTLIAHDDIMEWNVPGVRARARLGTAHPLISEAFAREPSLESVDFQVRGWRL